MKGLSVFDHYPKKLIYEPSERMKEYWKEHESRTSDSFRSNDTPEETKK